MLNFERVAHAIPANTELTDEERRTVLEVAIAAMAVDRAVHRDEVAVLARVAQRLGVAGQSDYLSALRQVLESGPDHARYQIQRAAARLGSPLSREIAFKAAYAVTLADLDADDREARFKDDLAEALSLSESV